MWLLFVLPSLAADPPCYAFTHASRQETTHGWIEWQDGALSEAKVPRLATALDDAWDELDDDLGFQAPGTSVAVTVGEILDGASAITTTEDCRGEPSPHILIHGTPVPPRLIAHELTHAFEYSYSGAYLQSASSWLWWMEATATWYENRAYGHEEAGWRRLNSAWVTHPHLALHDDVLGLTQDDRSDHLYGNALLARFIDTHHGGPDRVRQTWECGSAHQGERIWFPDLIAEMGADFGLLWTEFLALVVARDLDWDIAGTVRSALDVDALPADERVEGERAPQGLGFAPVRFDADVRGNAGDALEVVVTPDDPSLRWHGVLVDVNKETEPHLVRWTRLAPEGDTLTGVLSQFGGSQRVAWLVVSPEVAGADARPFSFSAAIVPDPGDQSEPELAAFEDVPCAFDPVDEPPEASTCGCETRGSAAWLALVPLLLVRRRSGRTRDTGVLWG